MLIALGFVCFFLMIVSATAWSQQGWLGWFMSGESLKSAFELLGALLEAMNSN